MLAPTFCSRLVTVSLLQQRPSFNFLCDLDFSLNVIKVCPDLLCHNCNQRHSKREKACGKAEMNVFFSKDESRQRKIKAAYEIGKQKSEKIINVSTDALPVKNMLNERMSCLHIHIVIGT